MSRKQSHDHKHTYQYQMPTSYNPNVKSPYIELLESKKKVYGHRFDYNKHNRSSGPQPQSTTQPTNINYNKSAKNTSSNFGNKPVKSVSSEKYPYSHNYSTGIEHKHSSSTHQKAKRVRTQHIQPNLKRPSSSNPYYHPINSKANKKTPHNIKQKLHESLNIYSSNNTYQSGQFQTFANQQNQQIIDDELEHHLQQISYQQQMLDQPKKQNTTNYYKNYLEELMKNRPDCNNKNKKNNLDNTYKMKKNSYGQNGTAKKGRIQNTKQIRNIGRQYPSTYSKQCGKVVKANNNNNLSFQQNTNKNKRKRHLSENKQIYEDGNISENQFQIGNQIDHINGGLNKIGLQNLQIGDIDNLIDLIDNCVQQANQYIGYLSQKMQQTKQQLLLTKTNLCSLEQQLKTKEYIISKQSQNLAKTEKDLQKRNKQIQVLTNKIKQKSQQTENNMQIRNLLQIVDKLNAENQKLRLQLRQANRQKTNQQKIRQDKFKDKQDQINQKIDFFNVSIQNKGSGSSEDQQRFKGKEFKQVQRQDLKKLKFIKPKYK